MAEGSTHIHVAPVKRHWTLQEVRLIGKGIIRLASALSAGVPDTDMITQWAAMNGNGKWLSIAGRQEAVQELEAIPCQEDKDKERDQLIQFLSPKRSLTWNFENLRGTGTVEMRRFPQSMTADASLHWIGLTLSMLAICLDQDLELSRFVSMIEDSTGGSIDPPTGLHSLLTGGPLALFEDLVMESAELLGLEDLVKFEAGFWRDQSLSRFT
ncbi:uncharacterized protein BDR25DRAFT_317554 [Lindgomyces ingoldianus]|uniref:Uncharacterized protein n=1 Tax=Lindgomyces ingoldianus TaxID=673940 RepID=A0ACB6QIW6_9PLEO|nr:uncharacterized protein BDR25DRAFT_317554 [Lindgomyces ingoldianus]KAF2466538.1 hypothetical protein BDR25DRAFT_317554 [Lindgomyces ingoldianus]